MQNKSPIIKRLSLYFREDDQGLLHAISCYAKSRKLSFVAAILNLLIKQIRHQDTYLQEEAIILKLLQDHFKDSKDRIKWMNTRNIILGNITPYEMIENGNFVELYEFIASSLHKKKNDGE